MPMTAGQRQCVHAVYLVHSCLSHPCALRQQNVRADHARDARCFTEYFVIERSFSLSGWYAELGAYKLSRIDKSTTLTSLVNVPIDT